MTTDADSDRSAASAPMEPATCVTDAVVRFSRAIQQIGNLRLERWTLTLSSYTALRVMANRSDLTLAQLSRRCFVRPQTMTRIVSQLESRGFVQRHPNPDSLRALSLRLTEEGSTALAEMDPEVFKINSTITGILDEGQIVQLDIMLRQCTVLVEAEIRDAAATSG